MASTAKKTPRFSPKSIRFLQAAGRQKRDTWLENPKNRAEFEKLLLEPLRHLASTLKSELGALAPDYNFPQKGIGRLKRSANRIAEHGGGPYKGWLTYSAARPRTSRFEHNPNLFFMIDSEDEDDPVLIAGGLYMPSSRQTRTLREAIARDATAFDELFATKDFARRFPGGFSPERISSRPTRGYDPNHPRMNWLRLQGFFVWRSYTLREFSSPKFAELVASDCRQILKMNRLMEKALQGAWPPAGTRARKPGRTAAGLIDRLEGIEAPRRKMDF